MKYAPIAVAPACLAAAAYVYTFGHGEGAAPVASFFLFAAIALVGHTAEKAWLNYQLRHRLVRY